MSLKDMQKQVDDWAKQFDPPYWQPPEVMLRLMEETGELAREVNHRWGPKKKKSTEEMKELEDEIGDILFTLSCLANSKNIDLDVAFARTMDKCWGRDKDRYKKKEDVT